MGLIQWLFSRRRPRSKSLAGVQRRHPFIPSLERLEDRTVLDDTSASLKGISARGLTLFGGGALDGSGVSIGEVDVDRPGKPGYDKDPDWIHRDVKPTKVYFQVRDARVNEAIGAHAEGVAGVMIADGPTNKGIAPKAKLYADAIGAPKSYEDFILDFQKVTAESAAAGSPVRAINVSIAAGLVGGAVLDGNSFLTKGVDWGARVNNTLYIVAGPEVGSPEVLPADDFNGITVAATRMVPAGNYERLSANNDTTFRLVGGRRAIDLAAPGSGILVPPLRNGAYTRHSGTSYAAPHVAGTVALLQQYAAERIQAGAAGWDPDAQRALVMKAVLLNSADKWKDFGNGVLANIVKQDGMSDWFNSDARDEEGYDLGREIPLDREMGTGQLDAQRALTQLSYSGKTRPTTVLGDTVPPIGWDYNLTLGRGDITKYALGLVKGGTYVTLTLTWNRDVRLTDKDGNEISGGFAKGDKFAADPLADLDLYLKVQGDPLEKKSVWSSVSTVDNVEHIYFKVPDRSKQYEVWVRQHSDTGPTPYALAWWVTPGVVVQPPPSGIACAVWEDLNGDGIHQGTEPGVANVTVNLYDASGTWMDTTTTDAEGNYHFDSIAAGDYYVVVTHPDGQEFTIEHAGGNDDLDSDVDSLGRSAIFSIGSDQAPCVDAGLVSVPYGSIGDYVWNDLNGDGLQDPDEPGIPDVAVYLYKADGTGLDVVYTDASGHYLFPSVEPGSYYLIFGQPEGYHFTLQDQGTDDTIDSDPDPATGQTAVFSIGVGEYNSTIDAGLVADPPITPGSIGGDVWQDLDGDGIQDPDEPGCAGVPVWLYYPDDTPVDFTITDASGDYSFSDVDPGDYYLAFGKPYGFDDSYDFSLPGQGTNPSLDSDADSTGSTSIFHISAGEVNTSIDAGLVLVPGRPASVGQIVWQDLNGNGIQDEGEPGVPGVSVEVFDANGNLVALATTDSNGLYQFTGLTPGSYFVHFLLVPGQQFTLPNQGSDPYFGSAVNPATGCTAPFTLISGQSNLTVNAGLIANPALSPATLGDFVWNDANDNGLQDAGELGVAGVHVSLFDPQGDLVDSTQTASNGLYQFTGLVPGSYYVRFTLPSGYLFSPPHLGTDAIDSDPDMTGRTASFTLAAGASRTTLDAGLVPNPGGNTSGTIGNFVWRDTNRNGIQDAGEMGVQGVQLQLYDGLGTLIATVLTDATGQYQFTAVAPGTYYVHVVLPASNTFSPEDQGTDDTKDSDVNADGFTAYFTLLGGQVKNDLDAGLMLTL
ncbi:MAG: carboxypeptidase regulatory-like domain-containing protein [Planctomycetes bacterium]|nr:carboxypeptidase regulatory-like domain-containing protein [Planctomycetota bacterium]